MKRILAGPCSLLAAAWLAVAGGAVAQESCPPTARPPDSAPSPPGWRAWRTNEATELPLVDLTFSDGPPEQRVFLAPRTRTTPGGERVEAYDFRSETYREIWLICQYKGSDIALVRQTTLRGKRCEVRHDARGAVDAARGLSCE